jgi:hypothetical protein
MLQSCYTIASIFIHKSRSCSQAKIIVKKKKKKKKRQGQMTSFHYQSTNREICDKFYFFSLETLLNRNYLKITTTSFL